MNEYDKANSYYENIKSNFNDNLKKDEAQQVLNDYKNGLGFKVYTNYINEYFSLEDLLIHHIKLIR